MKMFSNIYIKTKKGNGKGKPKALICQAPVVLHNSINYQLKISVMRRVLFLLVFTGLAVSVFYLLLQERRPKRQTAQQRKNLQRRRDADMAKPHQF